MSKDLIIKSYRLDELKHLDFSDSEYLPISELRIQSYINNPRATVTDKVLYLATINNKLVGFRTILPEKIFNKDQTFRVGNLSGSFTHPDFRRQGISSQLLKQVAEDWNQLLTTSNFSPESAKLFSKSGQFCTLKQLKGYKFFIKSPFKNSLNKRFPKYIFLSPLLSFSDFIVNTAFRKTGEISKTSEISFNKIDSISGSDAFFIQEFLRGKKGFLRGTEELNWVNKYSWIINSGSLTEPRYPFSLYVSTTLRLNFSIRNGEKIIGYLMLFLKQKQLTVPYLYLKKQASEQNKRTIAEIVVFIRQKVNELKAETLIITDERLAESYKKTRSYVFSKRRIQEFFISKELVEKIGDLSDFSIFDGDGDHVFSN